MKPMPTADREYHGGHGRFAWSRHIQDGVIYYSLAYQGAHAGRGVVVGVGARRDAVSRSALAAEIWRKRRRGWGA